MGINISIVAGQDKSASSINATGTVEYVITDKDRRAFGLRDKQLKDAVKAYFGKSPNDAYLKSPTPWGDLYKRYNWEQVKTVLVVESAEILSITSEPIIVKTQEFVNSSTEKATFDVSINDQVRNTTTSSWNHQNTVTGGQKFEYGVKFLGTGGKGETSLEYSHSWGSVEEESTWITVGSSSGVNVELDPGESVLSELSASRGVMKVRIRYKAYLVGQTAVNYSDTYKDHHFWGLPIDNVMSKGGISNSIKPIEEIEIGYYSNSKIEVKNESRRVGMKAANEKYVSADFNEGGRLVANRTHLDAWETFKLIKVGNKVAFKADNGKYVSADFNEGGRLVANRTHLDDWETFKLIER